jgi:hypothetical protein
MNIFSLCNWVWKWKLTVSTSRSEMLLWESSFHSQCSEFTWHHSQKCLVRLGMCGVLWGWLWIGWVYGRVWVWVGVCVWFCFFHSLYHKLIGNGLHQLKPLSNWLTHLLLQLYCDICFSGFSLWFILHQVAISSFSVCNTLRFQINLSKNLTLLYFEQFYQHLYTIDSR